MMLPEMTRFEPTWDDLELLKDGGVAIIDQWICAHARYSSQLTLRAYSIYSTIQLKVLHNVCIL